MSNDELYLAAGRAYCLKLFDYEPSAYVDETARLRHIENDATSTAVEPWLRAAVDAVVAALAGRLLPPVVETRVEWAHTDDDLGFMNYGLDEEKARWAVAKWGGLLKTCAVSKFADGSTLLGPWTEVSP